MSQVCVSARDKDRETTNPGSFPCDFIYKRAYNIRTSETLDCFVSNIIQLKATVTVRNNYKIGVTFKKIITSSKC